MLEVVYRDESLIAIDKPAGLLVHRSPIDHHETRFALQLLRDQIGQRVYPVHRLDKPTSGVLLFGLSANIAAQLAGQFERREVTKRYLAVTRGYCPQAGEIDHALRDKLDPMIDRGQTPKPARDAVTQYRCLATSEIPVAVDRYPRSRYSLVELKPLSGRKHQLRRHMKHIGHPIIGDVRHGKGVHNRYFQQAYDCHRLLLASTGLSFEHPLGGERIQLRCGIDEAFARVAEALGWYRLLHAALAEPPP